MYKLIGMPISPATQRVCWAFDYADIPYHFEEYLPQISTPWLRLRTLRLSGPVSVPILLGKGGIRLLDSWDIALRADHDRPQAGLFPEHEMTLIAHLNTLSEQLFFAGRMLALDRVLADNTALKQMFPPLIPVWCRSPLLPVMRNTIASIRKKYSDPGSTDQDLLTQLDGLLGQIRAQWDGKQYLLAGGFSYADMTIISALQVIRPYQSDRSQPQSAYERCWTCAGLAQQYEDLLRWRDQVYQEKREVNYRQQPLQHAVR